MTEREFGYLSFGGGMVRHLAFPNMGELLATLVREGPSGVYCSNSYYFEPSLPMNEKGWKGADLIFDIDADNLMLPCRSEHDIWTCRQCGLQQVGIRPEACPRCSSSRISEQNWGCAKCVEATKRETFKLLNILEDDFGIPNTGTSVYFSGSMGYHISVEAKEIEYLDNFARTEIAEYVLGRGILPETLGFHTKFPIEQVYDSLPSVGDPGWRGRIARYFKDIEYDVLDASVDSGGRTKKQKIGQEVGSETTRKIIKIYKKEKLEGFLNILEEGVQKTGVSIDPSVTMDIHRIFRLGGTLNGKTGLLKMKCPNKLESFDPLVDAVVLGDELMKVDVGLAPRFGLKGRVFGPFREEKSLELPTFAAVYLLCKGSAIVNRGA
jgi:DNA primase small subunit